MRRKLLTFFLVLIVVPAQGLWFLDGPSFAEKISIEALLLAIAAVMFAVQHTNELDAVADELRGITRALPTRGIGTFPRYLSEVTGLVERASESISVLCDTPAHGSFSNTPAFTAYWEALRLKMIQGEVEISCTFFDAKGREELHWAQIAADKECKRWKAWKKRNRENGVAFDRLARKHGIDPPQSNAQWPIDAWADTPASFVASMNGVNQAVLSSFDHSLKVQELPFKDPLHDGPSLYFWLRDHDQEAVFVIVPVQGKGVSDLAGFHTREPELIRALHTVLHSAEERSLNSGRAHRADVPDPESPLGHS